MDSNYIFEGLKSFIVWLVWVYLIGFFISVLINRYTDLGRDDTDPKNGRSNLIVLTDAKTGLQYLSTAKGGLIPRLDADGKQIIKVKP